MAQTPIAWNDTYLDSRERKVFTNLECQIPGLRMFGFHNTAHALVPLPPHYHENCFEFSFLARGNLCFSADGQSTRLTGGEWYITFPDEVHSSGGEPLSLHKMYWFQLDVSNPDGFLYTAGPAARKMIDSLRRLPNRVIRAKGNTEAVLSQILSAISQGTELGRMQAGYLLGASLCRILESANQPGFHLTADIEQSVAYIDTHLHESIPVEDLAGRSFLSVSRFKQKFKDQMGTGPRNYINYHKIEEAKKLLSRGSSVTDTAMALGFSNSNYFTTVFRRYTSQSPTEFKNAADQSRNSSL